MIRALLVDDEPVARRGLRALLEPHRDITVVGECRNGLEARSAFETLRPELVFLDVKMPDLDGFGALALSAESPPAVVFVTAFEEYARRAFDTGFEARKPLLELSATHFVHADDEIDDLRDQRHRPVDRPRHICPSALGHEREHHLA